MSKTYLTTKLEWDSVFFGLNCAKIELFDTLTAKEWIKINSFISNFDFVTIVSSNDIRNIQYLSNLNDCYLVDVPLILRLKNLNLDYKKNRCNRYLTLINGFHKSQFDFKKIENLASKSFFHSRFYRDIRIDANVANNLYSNWIINSINNDKHYFIVHKDSLGFILFTTIIDTIDVILISVDQENRGKGIATQLISELINYAKSENIKSITVSTQAHNLEALNLYTKFGFYFERIFYTFHYHRVNVL